jgi:hypothetical protein
MPGLDPGIYRDKSGGRKPAVLIPTWQQKLADFNLN